MWIFTAMITSNLVQCDLLSEADWLKFCLSIESPVVFCYFCECLLMNSIV
jgi:hypothetical protein